MSKAFESSLDTQNFAIIDGYAKAVSVLSRSHTPLCSISGGSDSDIVLDVIQNVDEKKKVHYFWIDTGLEYRATKEHLDYLEKKYDITIERIKACKPIPACCKEYGQPFLSKYVSEQIISVGGQALAGTAQEVPELQDCPAMVVQCLLYTGKRDCQNEPFLYQQKQVAQRVYDRQSAKFQDLQQML